ncbi:hypothetical protein AAY473_038034, partial [Plecturocebus cupreus]
MILAHCNPSLPGSSNSHVSVHQVAAIIGMYHHTWLIFVFLVGIGFPHIVQAGLELLTSGDPPTSASQNDGIIGTKSRFVARLEHSGMVLAHCNLHLLGSSDSSTSASQRWGLSLSPRLKCNHAIIAHGSLELQGSSDSPALCSSVAEATGTYHCTQLV